MRPPPLRHEHVVEVQIDLVDVRDRRCRRSRSRRGCARDWDRRRRTRSSPAANARSQRRPCGIPRRDAPALDAHRDELGRALAVADDRLREPLRDLGHRVAKLQRTRRCDASMISSARLRPVAISMKESLVEVSPSTVIAVERAIRSVAQRLLHQRVRQMCASVATKPSMVAMFGWIMPAPLAMPVMVTDAAADARLACETAFGSVSVVMIARRRGQPVVFAADRRRTPASPAAMRSTGSGSMITPVENGSTCSGARPSRRASLGAGLARVRPALARRCRHWRCRY